MPSSTGLMTAVSSHVASLLPDRLVGGALRAVYPRVEPELARIADFVPQGGTAVDIGAWYGPWTRRLRRLADRVVAIEPNDVLARSVENAFPEVRVIRAVASDRVGTAELFLPDEGPTVGTSSLESGTGRAITVQRVTIDGLDLQDVRFMKIDVEGHELPALRGAAETIHRDGPVLLIEVEERIQPVEPIIDLLGEWGYHGYVMPERQWIPRPRYVNSVLFKRS